MWSEYDNGDGTIFEIPIVCLALVEDDQGDRYVEPMDMASDGVIDFVSHEAKGVNFHV